MDRETIFDSIYKSVFFLGYLFRNLATRESGTILADLFGIILTPFFYFGLGALIGLIVDKKKGKKKK